MRHAFRTVLGLVFAFASCAAAAQSFAIENATAQRCETISQLAGAIMEARQNAMPLKDLLTPDPQTFDKKISNKFALDAFKSPRFSTPANQRQAIQDFTDAALRDCYMQIKS